VLALSDVFLALTVIFLACVSFAALMAGPRARQAGEGLPTRSQGHCGAVTPQGGGAVPWIGV
jgi:hypothetical protein